MATRRVVRTLEILVLLCVISTGGVVASELESVSPGALDALPQIGSRCPTFSWEWTPNTAYYEVVAYHLPEWFDPATTDDFELSKDTEVFYTRAPGRAASWTPDLAECLAAGIRYVWFVRAVGKQTDDGESPAGEWSTPRYFSIPLQPTAEEVRAALDTLQRHNSHQAAPAVSDAFDGSTDRFDHSSSVLESSNDPHRQAPKSVITGAAAIRGTQTDLAGETFGVVGTSASLNGGGIGAANTGGGADLILDGSADGATDANVTESGIERISNVPETFDITNPGAGDMTLQVDGIKVVTVATDQNTLPRDPGNQLDLAGNSLNVIEGPGSGLDADTLDGEDAASFAQTVHEHDARYYTETELNAPEGGGEVHWDNVTAVPTKVTQNPARGTLVVFGTSEDYTGANAPGYGRLGMHNACRSEDPESHFCSIQEIENGFRTTGVTFMTHSALWVDNVIIGSLSDTYDGNWVGVSDWAGGNGSSDHPLNCSAWRQENATYWGLSVNTGAISPSLGPCSSAHPIACCK